MGKVRGKRRSCDVHLYGESIQYDRSNVPAIQVEAFYPSICTQEIGSMLELSANGIVLGIRGIKQLSVRVLTD